MDFSGLPRWILALTLSLPALLNASPTVTGDQTDIKDPITPPDAAEIQRCVTDGECGWWWHFFDQEKEVSPEENAGAPIAEISPKEKKDPCASKDTWTTDCGFVDPDKDYDFMVVQRDALSKAALMNSADQKSVRQFQFYIRWLVDSALEYSRTWEYNMMQDSDLNPYASHPVSNFGLKASLSMFKDIKGGMFQEIIDQDGVLIFWTKESCKWCHVQAEAVEILSKKTGIPAYNVSIEGECVEGFEGEFCRPVNEISKSAAVTLGVKKVPDLFLLLDSKKPEANGWVRVSTGIEDAATIERRIITFFDAVRSATVAGLNAGNNEYKEGLRPDATFGREYYKNDRNGSSLGTSVDFQGGNL